jgi:hypothetical protein
MRNITITQILTSVNQLLSYKILLTKGKIQKKVKIIFNF